MKENGICRRFKDGLVCAWIVLLEDLKGLLPWRWFSRQKSPRPEPARRVSSWNPFSAGDWRREVLDDFSHWLKDLDSPSSAAPALDFSQDRFQVATEIAALRQELKRQNREQSKLNEELGNMEVLYREALSRLQAQGENLAALRHDVQQETERRVFLLFADLRDALQRGLAAVKASSEHTSFFRRPPPEWQAVEEGYGIALDRFDRAMAQLKIRRVPTLGQPFDPHCMVAIAARLEPGAPAGTVVDESLSGYLRNEEVLRNADVVVASNPTEENT